MSYDAESHLTGVTKNNVSVATFTYDGNGQMATSATGGVTTYYVGGYYEWHTAAAGSAAAKYYTAGSARVAMRQLGVVTYLFGDHLSSTSVAFDDAANTTRRQGYTAFGAERYSQGGDLPTRYQYTGQRGFEEVGLYYYNARWYDNALGRFAQADSIIPEESQGVQAWDRYAYVSNSPMNYTDPTGHKICEDSMEGCGNYSPPLINSSPNNDDVSTALTYISLGLDTVSMLLSAVEAGISDGIIIGFTAVGCGGGGAVGGFTVGAGCGAGLLAGLGFDVWFASASTLGGAENTLGGLSLVSTSLNDLLSGNTVLDSQQGNINIGKDTIISARNALAGLVPESNLDLVVSASQVKYDIDRVEGNKQNGAYNIVQNWNMNGNQFVNASLNLLFGDWW